MTIHRAQLVVLKYPNLDPAFPPILFPSSEILDADITQDSQTLTVVTSKQLHLFSVDKGESIQTIENPILNKTILCEFRACRFGRGETDGRLFTVVNSKVKKKGYVVKWEVTGLKKVGVAGIGKMASTFEMSADGSIFAFASQGERSFSVLINQRLGYYN